MRISVRFEVRDYPTCDSNYLCSEEINGKFIAIEFNQKIYSQANKSSEQNKERTRKSLKEAVDFAIKNKREAGRFFVYLDKGVFDLED